MLLLLREKIGIDSEYNTKNEKWTVWADVEFSNVRACGICYYLWALNGSVDSGIDL